MDDVNELLVLTSERALAADFSISPMRRKWPAGERGSNYLSLTAKTMILSRATSHFRAHVIKQRPCRALMQLGIGTCLEKQDITLHDVGRL